MFPALMSLAEFDYTLPPDLIAQEPASPRDASRLLVVDRATGRLTHRIFREIGDYLRPGDVLVLNDTRVMPARLRGRRTPSGGAVELLMVRPAAAGAWEALVRPGRRLPPGSVVEVGPHAVRLEIGERLPDGRRLVRLQDGGEILDLLHRTGEVPLPPYIRAPIGDRERYQTVYARHEGAVAAPTAGLHFTPELLERLRGQGVQIVTLTLHVGPGTFRPIVADDIAGHRMDPEPYAISPEAAGTIARRRGRLVAVGTTVVRALESAIGPDGRVRSGQGWTDLFIAPGYAFRGTEILVTNFHLPKTTLLLLVCAFAGRELVLRAYHEAIRERYRFYSFGDAMLIL
ncbi:MAG: tRNA preQ1(34) S-adenosylmethionine ribosyltransferase-isomerase QueA [Armatimonadota bacterium]|nr:tRNA preQ1(34) S-adenosylmethionine ribosyltransferase-isomerase QueA [Armatimonadota bacterium]